LILAESELPTEEKPRKHRILIVDDEQENLDLLESTLRRGNLLFKAATGEEAKEILGREKIHMVITDQRMPGISGTQLLEFLKETDEKAVRILITGYADMSVAVDAINKGGINRYISKPWDPSELRKIVAMEFERYDLEENNERLTAELLEKNEELEGANRQLEGQKDRIERLAMEYKEQKELAEGMSEKLSKSNLQLMKAQEEIKLKNVKLEGANKKLELLSITDALTGFYNKRYLNRILESELGRAKRYDLNLSLMMIDLDYFKEVNDTHGHPFGDVMLRNVTETIRRNIRETDWPTRYGGDEFVVILPHTGMDRAYYLAKRIHADVRALRMAAPNGDVVKQTVSIGIAFYPHPLASSKEEMISLSDRALYKAKEQGRDCIVVLD